MTFNGETLYKKNVFGKILITFELLHWFLRTLCQIKALEGVKKLIVSFDVGITIKEKSTRDALA